jgi:RNA polymerase sigma-70 factor (ECF subfamily)
MSDRTGQNTLDNFERDVLPYLRSAYNLARWLTRNDQDAEDVVQEASLRAFKYFDSFHGGNTQRWLLAIVRNTCYTWIKRNRTPELPASFDQESDSADCGSYNPETFQANAVDRRMLNEALENLPPEYREVVILRELEELTYKEIAEVTGVPLGTVMSRLARARRLLQIALRDRAANGNMVRSVFEK